MQESNPKKSTPTKPELKVKPVKDLDLVKDLEPDNSQSENVRGGLAAGPGRGGKWGVLGRFSDAGLKCQVAPIRHALVKLRTLRF